MTLSRNCSVGIEETKDGSGFTRRRFVVRRAVDCCLRAAGLAFCTNAG